MPTKYVIKIKNGLEEYQLKDAEAREELNKVKTAVGYEERGVTPAEAEALGLVDLGLPSGTLWAKCNIGAETETDYGLFFAWGETQGYQDASGTKKFNWGDYKFNPSGDGSTFTKYNDTDWKTILDDEDDAAYVNSNGKLRMPTKEQEEELYLNTDVEWIENFNGTGINGRKFINRKDSSKYIFIPASSYCYDGKRDGVGSYGYVWSSSRYANVDSAWYLGFLAVSIYMTYYSRYCGRSVRGVAKAFQTTSRKADKVQNSPQGNFPTLDAEGNLQDSGTKPADFVTKSDGDMLYEKDGIYQIKDNSVYPVSHPDLSTQPSVLPQRFGNLNIKEILIPLGNGNEWDISNYIPSGSLIIECSLFCDNAFASPLMRKKDGKWYLGIGNVYTDIEPKEWWALVRYVEADGGYYGYYGGGSQEVITVIDDTDDGTLVDLGLPSGTLWAKSNLGATKPSEYGLYFQWGDTQGYTADQVGSGEGQKYFGWADYKYCDGTSSVMTKYNSTDGKTELDNEDDAIYVATNGAMKMPTATQMEELYQYTDVSWIKTQNGVYGRKFTNKSDSSKYIFFPAAGGCDYGSVYYVGSSGYYWSSSLGTSSVIYGRYLYFNSGGYNMSGYDRYDGFAVRGVVG